MTLCWHSWSAWSRTYATQARQLNALLGIDSGWYPVLVQRRECSKCGKVKLREV